MADVTQLTGDYAASWLPWLLIPLTTYILPFPAFAILFLWIEREGNIDSTPGRTAPLGPPGSLPSEQLNVMGAEPTSSSETTG
ncbi:hypothetical protein PN498_10340 [Oscillatoria sp. CS-180]|uniref:hypothetical protein n=1 Tax=Oscillatoria sp. CS-180 TaxID=3021720 RepID=UPI00232DFED4|nr:hypothetical protein [Oscillatoria sp. CS-180]MDB9526386.1 hypothetical protein [Oscillatoria sp. CS-180]